MTVKDPACMSSAEINRELDRLRVQSSAFTDEMIAAGRGLERYTDWCDRTDELSRRGRAIYDRESALQVEARVRYGDSPPRPLPTGRGHGPRRRSRES